MCDNCTCDCVREPVPAEQTWESSFKKPSLAVWCYAAAVLLFAAALAAAVCGAVVHNFPAFLAMPVCIISGLVFWSAGTFFKKLAWNTGLSLDILKKRYGTGESDSISRFRSPGLAKWFKFLAGLFAVFLVVSLAGCFLPGFTAMEKVILLAPMSTFFALAVFIMWSIASFIRLAAYNTSTALDILQRNVETQDGGATGRWPALAIWCVVCAGFCFLVFFLQAVAVCCGMFEMLPQCVNWAVHGLVMILTARFAGSLFCNVDKTLSILRSSAAEAAPQRKYRTPALAVWLWITAVLHFSFYIYAVLTWQELLDSDIWLPGIAVAFAAGLISCVIMIFTASFVSSISKRTEETVGMLSGN